MAEQNRQSRFLTFRKYLSVLSKRDKIRVVAILLFQVLLGFLDLIGVILVGTLGIIATKNLDTSTTDSRFVYLLDLMGLGNATFTKQVIFVSAITLTFLIARTLISIFIIRKVLYFLARRGAVISKELVGKVLTQNLLQVQKRSTQESLFALTEGVQTLVLQVLAPSVILVSDLIILVILAAGLFLIDPITALCTIVLFLIIGRVLHQMMFVNARILGTQSRKFRIQSSEKVVEVLTSYRESIVRGRRNYYANLIGDLRQELANVTARTSFLPYISKYVIESFVLIGAILAMAYQFLTQDPASAIATLGIFLAGGARIAPLVLRVQQGIVSIRGNVAQAMPTLDLIDEVSKIGYEFENDVKFNDAHQDFIAEVVVKGLSFEYPGRNNSAVKEIEFKINQGDVVAIIGESGSGKTTLIDLLLGVLEPAQGRIQISGVSPKEAIMKWPGAISYVPQNVEVINGTILENLILGYAIEDVNQFAIERVLKLSSLNDFVSNLPNGVNTFVGERGSNVSGGQRQRLGIARALLTCPQLLVLDEATSALDLKTETQITKDIIGLRGMTTLIIVAHRINTIINADLILYLENGKVKGAGKFAEIKHLISHLIDASDSS